MGKRLTITEIKEGFRVEGVHTKDYGMSLKSRQAPPPEEKTIVEEVPFMHGVYDFSMILGERIFKNRPISYRFETYQRNYQHRKVDETVLKNWLMRKGIVHLYDDHNPGYYYLAKCTNVNIEDDHVYGRLLIDIAFDAYPFMVAENEEGNDEWDSFNFDLDYVQENEYTVTESKEINLMNVGSTGVTPTIVASSSMAINKKGVIYNVPSGESKSDSFRLEMGENPITITGKGTIKFLFHKELI